MYCVQLNKFWPYVKSDNRDHVVKSPLMFSNDMKCDIPSSRPYINVLQADIRHSIVQCLHTLAVVCSNFAFMIMYECFFWSYIASELVIGLCSYCCIVWGFYSRRWWRKGGEGWSGSRWCGGWVSGDHQQQLSWIDPSPAGTGYRGLQHASAASYGLHKGTSHLKSHHCRRTRGAVPATAGLQQR